MSLYRQPIILFGIVLPILVSAAVVGVSSVLKSQVVDSFNTKEKDAKNASMGVAAAREVEASEQPSPTNGSLERPAWARNEKLGQ